MGDLKVVQEFVRVLLQWDYAAMFEKYQAGEGLWDDLPHVPKTFKDIEEYQTMFEKMIMEETLAELMQGSESAELITPQPAVLTSSSNVAGFLEGTLILAEEHAAQYSHADLFVIDRTNPLDEENEDALKDHAVGHVDGRHGGTLHVKFLVSADAHAGNTASLERVKRVGAALNQPMSRWWVMRLGNIATLSREWAAIKRAERSPVRDILLSGSVRALPPAQHLQVPRGLLQYLKDNYNESQYKALTAGLDGRPLVLIQGPPGTGKTHTILGLLSVLKNSARKGTIVDSAEMPGHKNSAVDMELESILHKWHLSAPWLTANPHQTCPRTYWNPARIEQCSNLPDTVATCYGLKNLGPIIQLGASKLTKSRVLVCAPSNAALDEIVLRVLRHGLRDGQGNKVVPNIVRAGVAARMHSSIKTVTLEALISQQVGESADHREVDKATTAILNNADMVFSTLAFSGGSLFRKVTVPFDTLVIDEAAQALEPSCLVPLAASIKQVYMVGDPVQLPATVMSKRAVAANFQRSLFKRLQDAGYPVHILQVQYRMNATISHFASSTFYQGRIQDGPNVSEETERPFHKHPILGPLTFIHVDGVETTPPGSSSICNHAECDMVLALIQCLGTQHAPLVKEPLIGVIAPYKSQVIHIKQRLKEVLPETAANVDVNTIDGFQGREKDVIIFSTVRSVTGKDRARIGFVADERRINVGLTRARCSLIIVGQRKALEKDLHWGSLLRTVSERGTLFEAKPKFKTFLQGALSGKVLPVRMAPVQKQNTLFIPTAEDDAPVVPSKREASAASRANKKRQKH